jgi:diguanylate cyclase (GGDEF)-like protein/PAS domain S-box-containing protein
LSCSTFGPRRPSDINRDELLGKKVTNIVPTGFAERLVADELRSAEAALAQQIGTGIELIGRRKDCSEFPMELMLSPLESSGETLVTAAIRDISVRKKNELHLAQTQARYRGLLEAAPDAMVVVDPQGEIVLLNVRAEKTFGYHRDELLGKKVTNIVPTGFAERLVADGLRSAEATLAQQIGTGIELIGRRKDGSEFPMELMLSPLESSGETLVTAAIRDISVRKKNELELRKSVAELNRSSLDRRVMEQALFEEKERAEVTLNSIGDAVICTDILGNITFLNMVAQTVTGWSMAESSGRQMAEILKIVDGTTGKIVPDPLERAIDEDRARNLPCSAILIRRDGQEVPIEDSIAPIQNREGRITGAVTVFRDVSTARAMAMAMAHSVQHDFMTGLPNRMTLNDRIGQAIAFAARHRQRLAVLFLDLDGFKHINDSLGHPIGDKLLRSIAGRLVECVRGADTVSRQGGDEFVVLLSVVKNLEDAAITARRMLRAVVETHSIDQHELHVTASIGVSVYPDDGGDAETLVKNADTAMYQAKEKGRQGYQFFKPAMNVRAVERQAIEEGLRRAIEPKEFALHYQPKIDLRTGQITGAEALVRWNHPTRGNIPPAQFVSIAEDCGLVPRPSTSAHHSPIRASTPFPKGLMKRRW